jgi:O-glycosyl hydrolase
MRTCVRGIIVTSLSVLGALSACVSPTLDDPAPTQQATTPTDTTKKSSSDSTPSKKTPPPDTSKKPSTPPPPAPPAPTATAALGTPAQIVKGWGMYPTGNGGLYGQTQIADAIYASGITFTRVAFAPQLYVSGSTVNDIVLDQTQLVILIQSIQQAESYGVNSYIASVWSPPASMKTNDALAGGSLDSTAESAYVAYLTKIVMALGQSGVGLPSAVSIQNEPEFTATYSSAVYPVAQWQRVIVAARASFNANGLSGVTLFGPETGEFQGPIWFNPTTLTPGYFNGAGFPALANSSLNNAVGAYALHAYGECAIQQVEAGMQAYPKDAWMTEFSAPNGTTETDWMIDTYRALAAHLVVLPFNYWAWWNGWASSSGPPDDGSLLGGTSTPIYSKRYWALKQLWTTVRPGWQVVPMTTTDPTLQVGMGSQNPCTVRVDLLAFVSPNGTTAAVLMTNTTTANKLLAVSGLPGTTVQAYESDVNNDMVPQPVVAITNRTANIPLPPNSAVLAVAH